MRLTQMPGVLVVGGLEVDSVLAAGRGDRFVPKPGALVQLVQHVEPTRFPEDRRRVV